MHPALSNGVIWHRLVGAALVGLFSLSAGALPSTQSTFRATANRVALDVVVTDDRGHLVRDLTKNEFRVEERGKPQTVADVELITVGVANRQLENYGGGPVDVFSNARPASESRAVVFIIDDTSLAGEDIVPVKQLMSEFFRTLTDDDLAAVTYVRRSDLGQDFTSDFFRLTQSVRHLGAAIQHTPLLRDNLLVLKNVIATLAAARQTRRFVVYISHGFATTDISRPSTAEGARMTAMRNLSNGAFIMQVLREACEEARRQGIPIYTIDPRGLASPESAQNIGMIGSHEARKSLELLIESQQRFLQSVAEMTDGIAHVKRSDLQASVREIVQDNSGYYVVSYDPTPYTGDGKFHDVKVSVTRPGLRVRARSSYFASKPERAAGSAAGLKRILENGVPGGVLPLVGTLTPIVRMQNGGARVLTVIDVELPKQSADDVLDFAWVGIDPDGRVRASGAKSFPRPLRSNEPQAALSLHELLDLPRGVTTVRLALSSRVLGIQGGLHIPVSLAILDPEPIGISPPLVSLEGVHGEARTVIGTTGDAESRVPISPTANRAFTSSSTLTAWVRVFAPGSAAPSGRVLHGSAEVKAFRPTAVDTTSAPWTDWLASIPLEGLPAGRYVLELSVPAGDRRMLRTMPFTIRQK